MSTEPQPDKEERFRALQAHPDFEALLNFDPTAQGELRPAELGCGLAWGATILVLALAVSLAGSMFFPPLAVVPPVLLFVGAAALVQRVLRSGRKAPLEATAALLGTIRVQLSGDGPAARTSHLARLDFPDGTSRELEVDDEIAEGLVEGQVGVAYLRGRRVVAFRAVEL